MTIGTAENQFQKKNIRENKYYSGGNQATLPLTPINLDLLDNPLQLAVEKIPKVSQYLGEWIQMKQHSLRPRTALEYERLIHSYINPLLGDFLLSELNPRIINAFYKYLIEQGKGIRTIRFVHSVLHVALQNAVHFNYLEENPARRACLPKWEKGEMQILNENEVRVFLNACKQSKYCYLYYLAITTGMRMGEILGLKWEDVDWQRGTLSVKRQVQRVSGRGIVFSKPKTRAGTRVIKLGIGTINALREQRKLIQQMKSRKNGRWKENNLVFPSTVGTTIPTGNLRKDFYDVLENAGLPKIRFHDLRHTAATLMLNGGVPIMVVSKILGHSKPSVILDFYSHCTIGMQDEAASIIDKVVNIG